MASLKQQASSTTIIAHLSWCDWWDVLYVRISIVVLVGRYNVSTTTVMDVHN